MRGINKQFFGTATVGEKGQVVIPAEAREYMHLEKGEKLLAFGMDTDMLMLTKVSKLEDLASHLAKKLEHIQAAIKKSKQA